jgi:hypothetical protein
MTTRTLPEYENQKSVKNIISWIMGAIFAYITVCYASKCGLGKVMKVMEYATLETENKKLPSDYLTWYKERKMEESWVHKQFGHEASYFTYRKIAERETKKVGGKIWEDLHNKLILGNLGDYTGNVFKLTTSFLTSLSSDPQKINHAAYARDIYGNAAMFILCGFFLFWLIYGYLLCFVFFFFLTNKRKIFLTEENN